MNLFFQFAAEYWYLFVAMIIILLLISADEILNPANKKISVLEVGPKVNDSDGLILDVSTDTEYQAGHIAGAHNLPLANIKDVETRFAKYKEKPVVVVCQSGQRSRTAAQTLVKSGFTDVYNLQGGMGEWRRENLPVQRSKKAAKKSTKSQKAKAKSKKK